MTGSLGSLVQSSAVTVLQGLATQQVKGLVDGIDDPNAREATRAALQGLVGCAGASAGGSGSCGGAVLGASASVVLNNLLKSGANTGVGPDGKPLSQSEVEARQDVVATIVGAIATGAGLDANSAVTAAEIETANNATARTRYGAVCVAGTSTGCSSLTVQQMLAGNRNNWAPVLQSIAKALGSDNSEAIAEVYTQLASDAAVTGRPITDAQIANSVAAYKDGQVGGNLAAAAQPDPLPTQLAILPNRSRPSTQYSRLDANRFRGDAVLINMANGAATYSGGRTSTLWLLVRMR